MAGSGAQASRPHLWPRWPEVVWYNNVRTAQDHADRLLKVEHTLGGTNVTLAAYGYDNFGRLQSKSLHGSSTNKLTYAYNVRNWLTGISGSKFTQNLYYNTGNGTARYNGSISSMT